MQTVLSIIGTRPEAIKMAPVILELRQRPAEFRSIVASTGQHRQMLGQVLDLFQIVPEVELNLMQWDQSLSGLTGALFTSLDGVIAKSAPDWVVAQGDTTTAMVSAMVAFYRRIKFAHVEAGLRTGDIRRPFPEEVNRRIADLVADLHFAPTRWAAQNLLREGIAPDRVHVTGNTVVDALLQVAAQPYDWSLGPLAALPREKKLVLITAHRRESFGEPFRELCMAIRHLAERYEPAGVHFAYPVHLNPNVRQPVQEILSGSSNISLMVPLDYRDLVQLMKRASLVLTDSGGIQEEAPIFGVPVLVMRETTERPEGVEAGSVRLVGTKHDRIVREVSNVLENGSFIAAAQRGNNPYGDGKAAQKIVSLLLDNRRP
jgi:UDP-N-acetylglucosamine 2-epimerase (non-hydrolysing)